MDVSEDVRIINKKMSKNGLGNSFTWYLFFDKVYLPLYLNNIFPELGSTLGYCIEALNVLVKTAEDLYALKTLLRRAGQYL